MKLVILIALLGLIGCGREAINPRKATILWTKKPSIIPSRASKMFLKK